MLTPHIAAADEISVVADIGPVGLLVQAVHEGAPKVLLPPGASPHHYALRPSDAAALETADLVVWIGPALTPWLEGTVATLARDARSLELMEAAGTTRIEIEEHENHAESDGHDHGPVDPHAWLDPENARIWLSLIADVLGSVDESRMDEFRENVERATADIDSAITDVRAALEGRSPRYVLYHDALRYFEARFGVAAAAVVTESEDAPPGPRRLSEVRELLRSGEIACLVSEPGVPERNLRALTDGTDIRHIEIDVLGADTESYVDLIRNIGTALADCT